MSQEPDQTSPTPAARAVAGRIRIVLVGTQHPGNIGAAARARILQSHTAGHRARELENLIERLVVPDITNRIEKGEIPVHWRHRVARIGWTEVVLRDVDTGVERVVPNDAVVAMTGWRADPHLLRSLGVPIDAATGVPAHDPETMETDVAGVYIAGVIAAGHDANRIFIENGREHGGRILRALGAELPGA